MDAGIEISPEMQSLLKEIKGNRELRSVYVLGAPDTGKTVLSAYLYTNLAKDFKSAFLDCDPGQSSIGLPATVGLLFPDAESGCGFPGKASYLAFTGCTSPAHDPLRTAVAIKKLEEKAFGSGIEKLVIDSSGYVSGASALDFQFNLIDCLAPDLIIAVEPDLSIHGVTKGFAARAKVKKINASLECRVRTQEERRLARERKIGEYFRNAKLFSSSFRDLGVHGLRRDMPGIDHSNRLIAICNRNNFIVSLGIVKKLDSGTFECVFYAPDFVPGRIANIMFGRLRCRLDGTEI